MIKRRQSISKRQQIQIDPRSGLGYISRPRDPDSVQMDLNHGLGRSKISPLWRFSCIYWKVNKETKFERFLVQGDQERRGSTRRSRGTDKHAPMHSPLQVACCPLFLVHGILLQYRGPWECWLPTVGREKEKTVFEMLRNIFYPQAALCPRLWGVRQPPHWPGKRKFFLTLRANQLFKVCYRGLLTTLLCSPYEGKEGWEVTAARWRGTIYLRQQVCI